MNYNFDKVITIGSIGLNFYTPILEGNSIYIVSDIDKLENEGAYNKLYNVLNYSNKNIIKKLNLIRKLESYSKVEATLKEITTFYASLEKIGIFKNFKAGEFNNEFLKKIVDYAIYYKFLDLLSYIFDGFVSFRDILFPEETFRDVIDFNFRND